MEFGQLIKDARRSQGLTQTQLAAATEVGLRFIVELEHGKPSCELNKALKVAGRLGIAVVFRMPEHG